MYDVQRWDVVSGAWLVEAARLSLGDAVQYLYSRYPASYRAAGWVRVVKG